MMPGYQASDSENAYDFFFRFFSFFNPTDPISGKAFDGKQKKKGGMALQQREGEYTKKSCDCKTDNHGS